MEVWQETGTFPPDSETVRRKAYKYYEQELKQGNTTEKILRGD